MIIKRREFLQVGSLATASVLVPKFLKVFEARPDDLFGRGKNLVPSGNKVLVILQLSGGNDGLNTVIPFRNDIYYKSRPKLGIEKAKVLSLTDEAGLHPALTGLKELYGDGSLSILNNVGYPNPDRSHFRSMDIWHSASDSRDYWNTGWLGRYLDAQCQGCDKPTYALELDDTLSLAMKGEQAKAIAMKDPKRLFGTANQRFFKEVMQQHKPARLSHSRPYRHGQAGGDEPEEQPVDYLYKTMAETISSADYIFEKSKLHPSKADYPKTELGNNLKTIASLIFSDINTKVYYVSLGSFDTHINQQIQQQNLFTQLNEAVKSFVKDLKANNRFNDVMLMSFSEFGRRVSQNGSGGTDHGTANNMFFISGALKQKGLINPMPDLADLEEGDLKFNVDFKNVYATVLKNWLGADEAAILKNKYSYLDFI